jgi:ABC-type amino acid transport system permease subunit
MEIEKNKQPRTWKQYGMNIVYAIRGQEQFIDASGASTTSMGFGMFFILLTFVIAFLVCYGAARLSWCYNTFYGESTTVKVIFSVLCFFFPQLYYPFYALFLDPVCGRVKNQVGGKR